MEKTDEIKREMLIDAPIERLWEAISSAEQISRWFGDVSEVAPHPGGGARFGWTEYGDVFEAEVVTLEAPVRFAYRWALESDKSLEESYTTLVEFTLERQGEKTHLTLVESGFAAIPDVHYQKHFDENSRGWNAELRDLEGYLAGVRPVV